MSTGIKVGAQDLKRIGHIVVCMDYVCGFYCMLETANIEYILLREILEPMGHSITATIYLEGEWDDAFLTTLPYSEYEKISGERLERPMNLDTVSDYYDQDILL